LDGLDQIVAVARLLFDQIERDQAQIARCQHAADAEAVAPVAPAATRAAGTTRARTAPAKAAAAAHGFELAVHAVLRAMQTIVGAIEVVIKMGHIVSPIYLTIVGRYAWAAVASR